MKLKKIEPFIVIALFLFTVFLWSLPYQNNRMPYGEVDAGSHFTVGDYIAGTDKSIVTLPYFIDKRYGEDNQFKAHTWWYAPPYHVNFAIMQIIAGERVLPIFLFNTILCSIIVLITYFVMRKLFGFWPALLSSFLLIFSLRDIMVYLFGQWPQQIAFFYTPLILYTFYKYTKSFIEKKEKNTYLYIMALLLAINFFFHPMAFFHTALALVIFTILLSIKERKLIFNIKKIPIAILIFILFIAIFPYQTGNVFVKATGDTSPSNPYKGDFPALFSWFGMEEYYGPRLPSQYFSYSEMNKIWTLPLLLLGLLFILIRRKRKDLLLLSYLIGTYLMIHLIFFGFGRPERSLAASAHIFYPLIALGLLAIPNFLSIIKIPKNIRNKIKYVLIALFFVFVLLYNFNPVYDQLKEAYSGISRVTPVQYEAAVWIKDNLPDEANVLTLGPLMTQKIRWMRYISWHYMYDEGEVIPTHIVLDYSDLILLQNDPGFRQRLEQLNQYEQENLQDKVPVYNKNNIKVYKLEE